MSESQRKAFDAWFTERAQSQEEMPTRLEAWQAATAHILALLDRPEVVEAVRLQIYSHSPLNTPASAELTQRIMPALKEEISKMTDTPDNPPAFPTHNGLDKNNRPHGGMGLLDWFAGMALQGQLAAEANQPDENNPSYSSYRDIAENSYLLAEAMLAERAQRKP